MYIRNILITCLFLVSWANLSAQETMEIKVMSAVNQSETNYIIIASIVSGEADALITEIVELPKYGDFKTVNIPASAEIFVLASTTSSGFNKLSPLPSQYQDTAKRMSVEGMKSCNLVLTKDNDGLPHYKLSNIQW